MSAEVTPAIERVKIALENLFGGDVFDSEARAAAEAMVDVAEIARVDAETTRCSWSIPQDGHPYSESCLYKRDRIDGQVSHGACWDEPYARAEALRTALLGADS